MNRRFRLLNHVGKISGVVLGACIGWPAIPFGVVLGLLIDSAVQVRRRLATMHVLLRGETPKNVQPQDYLLAAIVSVWLTARGAGVHIDLENTRAFVVEQMGTRGELVFRQLLETAVADQDVCRRLLACAGQQLPEDRVSAFRRHFLGGDGQGGMLDVLDQLMQGRSQHRCDGERSESAADLPRSYRQACRVLGISPRASGKHVKEQYRRLVSQFHPDTAVGCSEEQQAQVEDAFRRVSAAYELVCSFRRDMRAPTEESRSTSFS